MSVAHGFLILAGVAVACLLMGAWLAPRLGLTSPSLRVAAALLGGLYTLLLAIAAVNLVLPLRGAALLLVAAPALASLVRPSALRTLGSDLRATLGTTGGAAFVIGAALFLTLLLWPRWTGNDLVFYDGSPNHDAYFWITGADHLQKATYLSPVAQDVDRPAMNFVGAISGWLPPWGRMGAEGYLATVAGAAGVSPLEVYLWAAAALFCAWIAIVYLVVRTFVADTLHWPAALSLAVFQPLFAFYHHNANLPNLLGMLAGAGLVVATENICRGAARPDGSWRGWAMFAVLAWHALFCSYPEMAPFIAFPCALLWLRSARGPGAGTAFRWLLGASAVALAINPTTTIRAVHGFLISFASARANENWSNLLSASSPGEFLPVLLTLSPKLGREVGQIGGAMLTAAALIALTVTWARARDRIGVGCMLAGALALAGYTALTGFHYGWQKTVQFSGVFIAALLPVGTVELPVAAAPRRVAGYAVSAVVFGVFAFVAVVVQLDLLKWSARKSIHRDWLELSSAVDRAPADRPVIVDAPTFRWAFFHGMWAAYFMPGRPIAYAQRGVENGGYLRSTVASEDPALAPAAILVGHAWAQMLDANSPRLAVGQEWALLSRANRVLALDGVEPATGAPQTAGKKFALQIVPHSDAQLEIALRAPERETRGAWRATVALEEHVMDYELTFDGSAWRGRVPLAAGAAQRITFEFSPAENPEAARGSFTIERLAIVSRAP